MNKFIIFILIFFVHSTTCMSWFNHFRATTAYQNGDMQKAEQLLDNAITASPHDQQALYNRGKVAYAQKDFEKAEAYFEKATQEDKNNHLTMQAWFDKGNAQVQQKKLEPALSSYQEVIKLAPEHAQAHDMIEQIKKLIQQQKQQQQQNQKQDKDKNNNDKNDNPDKDSGEQEQSDDQGNDQQSKQQNKEDLEQENKDTKQNQKGTDDDRGKSERDQRQQPQNKPDQEKKQDKGENPEQHKNPSEKQEQTSSKDGTQNKEKTQGSSRLEEQKAGLDGQQEQQQKPDEYAKLFAALDQRDEQISKDMLKANLKEAMPQKYGQKNW